MIDRRLPPVITWPAIAFLAVFLIYPIGITVAISFWDYQSMRGMEPAFLSKNYLKLLADPYYLGILANTVRISVPEWRNAGSGDFCRSGTADDLGGDPYPRLGDNSGG